MAIDDLPGPVVNFLNVIGVPWPYINEDQVSQFATLIGLAATFVADQAAAVATFGIAEAAVPLIIEAGERLVKSLVMDLQQEIIGKVIEAAAKPLFAKVEAAM